jgi:hypothetical protein
MQIAISPPFAISLLARKVNVCRKMYSLLWTSRQASLLEIWVHEGILGAARPTVTIQVRTWLTFELLIWSSSVANMDGLLSQNCSKNQGQFSRMLFATDSTMTAGYDAIAVDPP